MNDGELIKKNKFEMGDKIIINNKKAKIIFGPFEKGFFSFYEIEYDNGTVEQVNSKFIKKQ